CSRRNDENGVVGEADLSGNPGNSGNKRPAPNNSSSPASDSAPSTNRIRRNAGQASGPPGRQNLPGSLPGSLGASSGASFPFGSSNAPANAGNPRAPSGQNSPSGPRSPAQTGPDPENQTVFLVPTEVMAIRSTSRLQKMMDLFTGEPKSLGNMRELYHALLALAENDRTRNLLPPHLLDIVDPYAGSASPNYPTRDAEWRDGPSWGVEGELVGFTKNSPRYHQNHIGAIFGQMAAGFVPLEKMCNNCAQGNTRPFRRCGIAHGIIGGAKERMKWCGACPNCRFQSRDAIGGTKKGCSYADAENGACTPDGTGRMRKSSGPGFYRRG
ncbi:hypothetical protein EG328_008420, partial [Venturia inaequalis]